MCELHENEGTVLCEKENSSNRRKSENNGLGDSFERSKRQNGTGKLLNSREATWNFRQNTPANKPISGESYKNHLWIVTGKKYRQGRNLEEYDQITGKCSVTGFVTGLVIDIVYIFDKWGYDSYRVTEISERFEKMLFQPYSYGRDKTYFWYHNHSSQMRFITYVLVFSVTL